MASHFRDKITLLALTYNRYQFIARLVEYYQFCGAPFEMRILDSSSERVGEAEMSQLIRSDSIRLFRYGPGIHPITKQYEALKDVTTPYVVVWADDDFLVPGALEEGIGFLEEHPGYSALRGQGATFNVGPDGSLRVGPYIQRSYLEGTASARLLSYLGSYSVTVYCIHRTSNLRRNMDLCHQHGFGYAWGEIALGCLSAIQGKIGKLDRLYLLKEAHSGTDSWRQSGDGLDIFDWITGPDFSGKCQVFSNCLATELAQQDGISIDTAREVVKQAFWSYLARGLTWKWQGRYAQNSLGPYSRLRGVAKRVSILRRAWHTSHSFLPGENNKMSLPALLRPTSPYHRDFMPIYRAITSTGGNLQGTGDSPGQPPGAAAGSSSAPEGKSRGNRANSSVKQDHPS